MLEVVTSREETITRIITDKIVKSGGIITIKEEMALIIDMVIDAPLKISSSSNRNLAMRADLVIKILKTLGVVFHAMLLHQVVLVKIKNNDHLDFRLLVNKVAILDLIAGQ